MNEGRLERKYIYISKRLSQAIVDQYSAERGKKYQFGGIRAGLPFLSGAVERAGGPHPTDNPYELAIRAAEVAENQTGTLDAPGRFVRDIVDLEWWDLKTKDNKFRVAWMTARLPEAPDVVMCLCGSIHHYVDFERGAEQPAGWRPSSFQGMATVARAFNQIPRYSGDLEVPSDDPQRSQMLREAGVVAVTLDASKGDALGEGRMEIFAETFDSRVGVRALTGRFGAKQFDVLSVGAPIWVRTPPAEPLQERPLPTSP